MFYYVFFLQKGLLCFFFAKRYALDWLHDERIVKVIYGDDAHIICTIHINTDYPSAGSVQLQSVEGIQDGPDPSTIKPDATNSQVKLAHWLQYLHDYFH